MKIKTTYNLGVELKDKVTNFSGICLGITKYDTGCIHYGLCPKKVGTDNKIQWIWFDEIRIDLVKKKAVVLNMREALSGPKENPPMSQN